MDLVQILILSGFGIGNLVGFALWLYQYCHESHKTKWYKDFSFWSWEVMTLLFGTAYAVLRLILWLREKIQVK